MRRAGGKAVGLAAVVAALVVGCGGSDRLSKSEYEQKMQDEGQQLKTAFQAVDVSDVSNPQELSTKITSLQQELDDSADDLDELKPPEDAEDAHDKLVKGLRDFSHKFGELKQAAKNGDQAEIEQIETELEPIGNRLNGATQELKDKGYDIGELGED